ncbi:MAG: hypothetical protein L3K26_06780 [Candidatus Hydrogenedentes bacterium]|nr:hypothetical protein [Candidatus Hydrogenedentota bacterium]
MNTCKWTQKVEAYTDGESHDHSAVEAHIADCALCARHRATMLHMRSALGALPEAPSLSDGQFPAFMEGIHEGVSHSRKRPGGIWALMSLSAAALVIAIATFSMFTGPGPVKANEVESVSTQLEGGTAHWDISDDGVTTIWISIAEDDF